MHDTCTACHLKTIQAIKAKFLSDSIQASTFEQEAIQVLTRNKNLSNPEIAKIIHQFFRESLQNPDPYKEEKRRANEQILSTYSHWKNEISKENSGLNLALKLSVIGNIIDYGAHSVPENINLFIEEYLKTPFSIDHSDHLISQIKEAKTILYLGDNCGEIVFDKLLIETIQHSNLTFVARGNPVINDATMDDAKSIGMHHVCNVIDNGSNAPSTILNDCSLQVQTAFKNADLVISKGQGNFEGLMHEKRKNLFFLLMSKCSPISEMLGTKTNSLIIKEN